MRAWTLSRSHFTTVILTILVATFAGVGGAKPAYGWMDRYEVQIPMRDGKHLAADLYLPDSSHRWPTILIQTPYNKAWYRLGGPPLDTKDYAFVIADWRGFWGSRDAFVLLPNRGKDGYDCVEWIADQKWSDGHVGTWGASALGIVQYQTAREQPPHLDACVPMVADFKMHYERYYPGGILLEAHVDMLDRHFIGMKDSLLAHPSHDWLWKRQEQSTDFPEDIADPMLIIGGWYDYTPASVIRAYNDLITRSDPQVRTDHRLVMGPWVHSGIDEKKQGQLRYRKAAGSAEKAAIAWFDYWLRGVGPGITEPPVRWFDMGTKAWQQIDTWPGSNSQQTVLYLHEDGSLSEQAPIEAVSSSEMPYDPSRPSPSVGGAVGYGLLKWKKEGPYDQRDGVEGRADVLTFTTEPLSQDLTIAGPVSAAIYLSSDRPDTDVMVRLTDVYPDGRSMLILDAARRARFRINFDAEQLLEPGVVYEIPVNLQDTGITIPVGHRIRIDVSSSNNSRYFANPNDGGPLYKKNAELFIANNVVYHEQDHPSRLILTTLP
ncbi:MAG: CocE/NonD family hydrolase [Planctomycetes bacterium]|nr:CocE/NonD family hydrolase [Planctomycetota bacterium]